MIKKYSEILCDPITKKNLEFENGDYYSGDSHYPVINGIPVLLKDQKVLQEQVVKLREDNRKEGFSWVLKHWDDCRIGQLLGDPISENSLILNFGSGSPKEKEKIIDLGYNILNIDINAKYLGVDIICDGHYLPFKDKSFQAVTAFEVLEHLEEPWNAIREINRVLPVGGKFVGTVAFLKEFHASYFHMTHWGVWKLLKYGGFDLEVVYGGQDVFSRLIGKIVPLGRENVSESLYKQIDRMIMGLRKNLWSAKKRKKYSDKNYVEDAGGIRLSFEEYDRIKFAPTIIFKGVKVKNL